MYLWKRNKLIINNHKKIGNIIITIKVRAKKSLQNIKLKIHEEIMKSWINIEYIKKSVKLKLKFLKKGRKGELHNRKNLKESEDMKKTAKFEEI